MELTWMECSSYGRNALKAGRDGVPGFYGGVPWVAAIRDAEHRSGHVSHLPIGAAAIWNAHNHTFDEVVELRGLTLEEKKRALETMVRMGV
jgi:hypothetical protein